MKKYSIGKFAEEIGDTNQIVTVFSVRLQGKCVHKIKKMIEELRYDDSYKEN